MPDCIVIRVNAHMFTSFAPVSGRIEHGMNRTVQTHWQTPAEEHQAANGAIVQIAYTSLATTLNQRARA
jgi:hypothetical protein